MHSPNPYVVAHGTTKATTRIATTRITFNLLDHFVVQYSKVYLRLLLLHMHLTIDLLHYNFSAAAAKC